MKVKQETYKVYKNCDICGNIMKFTGSALMTSPVMYRHKCTACEYTTTYNKIYPCIEYEELK